MVISQIVQAINIFMLAKFNVYITSEGVFWAFSFSKKYRVGLTHNLVF